jgi:hypothetical protein
MKKGRLLVSVSAFMLLLSMAGARAESFTPLFTTLQVKGTCEEGKNSTYCVIERLSDDQLKKILDKADDNFELPNIE